MNGAAFNHQPQLTETNQNVPYNQMRSSMNRNDMLNLQYPSLLQPMLQNTSAMVSPVTMHRQHAPTFDQNNMTERFNHFLIEQNNFPPNVTNSINELLVFSGPVPASGTIIPPPPLSQTPTVIDSIHPSAAAHRCFENEDNDDDKKPPAR